MALLILSLAPFPRMSKRLRKFAPAASRIAAATVALAFGCLSTAVRAYPFYIAYINVFSFGHPSTRWSTARMWTGTKRYRKSSALPSSTTPKQLT